MCRYWWGGAGILDVVTATDAVRDSHYRAMRWSHVLAWQVDRLYQARRLAMESHQKVLAKSFYGDADAWPFHRMGAEAHFALTAARQLMTALLAFDGDLRLPHNLSAEQVRLVRNALEHWDEPNGPSGRAMAERGADASDHKWSMDGPGLLGTLVSDAALREWAVAVYDELLTWDPW